MRKSFGTATILNDYDRRQIANVERTTSDEPLGTSKGAAFDSRVSVSIHSYRCRLVDVDGVSGKAALDALVLAGIIADDSTKEVSEVRYFQTKVKNKSEEKVVITVTALV